MCWVARRPLNETPVPLPEALPTTPVSQRRVRVFFLSPFFDETRRAATVTRSVSVLETALSL